MAIDYTKPTVGKDSMAGKLLAQKQAILNRPMPAAMSFSAERELLQGIVEQLEDVRGAVDEAKPVQKIRYEKAPKPVQKISYKKVPKPDLSSAPRFQALKPCPRCGEWRVHRLAEPNPDPPNVVQGGEVLCTADDPQAEDLLNQPGSVTQIESWGGLQPRRTINHGPRLDRFDERGFEVIRICPECAHTWGEI